LTFTFTVAPAAAASLTFVVGIAPTNDDVNEVRLSVGQQTILDRNKVQVRDNSLWLVTAAVPSGETSVSLTMKANSSGNNKDFSIYVGGIALQAVSYCQGIDPNRGWDDEDAVAKIKQILTAIEADGDADLDAPEPHPTGRHLTSGSLLDQQNLRDEVNRTGTGHHGAGSSGPEWDYTAFDDSPYGECKLLEHLYDKVIDSQSQPSPTPQQDADHNVTVTKVAHVCDPLPPGEPTEEDISECLAETSPLPDPIPEVSVNSFVVWEYIVTNNNLFGSVDLQGATIDDDQLPLTCPPRRITPKTTDPSWSLDGSIPVMSWAPGIWQTDTKVPPNGGQASCVMFDRAIQLTPTPTPSEGAGP
jgi:hypothetical protein